jgi:predicted KAP-like P-loop ATPase
VSFAGKFARYVPLIGEAGGKVMEDAGTSIESNIHAPSLANQKAAIETQLRKLSQKIIVFIDDLDRLETAEVIEILRLVRAVADFPNIIYVLSYDPDILSHTVEQSTIAPNGKAFSREDSASKLQGP